MWRAQRLEQGEGMSECEWTMTGLYSGNQIEIPSLLYLEVARNSEGFWF